MLHLFEAVNCKSFSADADAITLACSGGQDDFNIPKLHSAWNIAYAAMDVSGSFTFAVSCTLFCKKKFDAAGIYLLFEGCRVKHGLEMYGEADFRVVTVRSFPLSDESNGSVVPLSLVDLIATRDGGIFSFYSRSGGQLRFERAFAVEDAPETIKVGLFVQSPFSDGASARFEKLDIKNEPFEHVRL